MSPKIEELKELAPDQSVIVLYGNDGVLKDLKLSNTENDYVKKCLADKDELIVLNSYFKLLIIVPEKVDLTDFKRREESRRTAVKALDVLRQYKVKTIAVANFGVKQDSFTAFAEGLVMASYRFVVHKTLTRVEKQKLLPEKFLFLNLADFDYIKTLRDALYFARDLVNEPLSHLSAVNLADRVKEFVSQGGVTAEIFGIRKIEALKMGGLLAVNRGSLDPPSFTVLEWKPENCLNKKPVVLIGKGVVFDAGGLNLKPTSYIEDMKSDMAGAAAVAGVIYAAARLKLPLFIKALIPATDNRPGVRAFAPGDIIKMHNGKNVEVMNTDAEGRLILADALSYAENFSPSLVITVATLTGSAANTFGKQAIAMMGNAKDKVMEQMTLAGESTYERVAMLPFWEEYGEMIKSDIADLKNLGEKEAGAITAGKFLESFTHAPFIHLDIAGTAILTKDNFYCLKGGTGAGVRILTEFLKRAADGSVELK